MQLPVWTSPALYGAVCGAVALAVVGFTWGGWVTGGTARTMAEKASSNAVVAVLTPYCLERSRQDPRAEEILAELKAASSYNRRAIIEKAGWATPPGSEQPNRDLAHACQAVLRSA